MAKPQKFRIRIPQARIVNRCIMCGRVIPMNRVICSSCDQKRRKMRVKHLKKQSKSGENP